MQTLTEFRYKKTETEIFKRRDVPGKNTQCVTTIGNETAAKITVIE